MRTRSKEFTLTTFINDCFSPEKLHAIAQAGYSRLPFCIDKHVSSAVVQDIFNCFENDLGFTKQRDSELLTPYNLVIEVIRKDLQIYNIRGNSFYCVISRKFKVDSELLTNLIGTLNTTNKVFHEKCLTFNRPFLV